MNHYTNHVLSHCEYGQYLQIQDIEDRIRQQQNDGNNVPSFREEARTMHRWRRRDDQIPCRQHHHSKVCLNLSCGRNLCFTCIQSFRKILDRPSKGQKRTYVKCTCGIFIHESEITMWLEELPKTVTEARIIQRFDQERRCNHHKDSAVCAKLPCDVLLCHQCIVDLIENAKLRHNREPVNQKQPYQAYCPGCRDTIPGELLELFLKEFNSVQLPVFHHYSTDSWCRFHQHHKIVLRNDVFSLLCKMCFEEKIHSDILLDEKRYSVKDAMKLFGDLSQEELFRPTPGLTCDCGVLKAQAKLPCGLYICYHCVHELEQRNGGSCPKCRDILSAQHLRTFLEKYDESECYLVPTTGIKRNCFDHKHWKVFCESNKPFRDKLCLICISLNKKFPELPSNAVQHFLQKSGLKMKDLHDIPKHAQFSYSCMQHKHHKVICEVPCINGFCLRCIEELLQSTKAQDVKVAGDSVKCVECRGCADLIPLDVLKSSMEMFKEGSNVEITCCEYYLHCRCGSGKEAAYLPCGALFCKDCFVKARSSGTIDGLGKECITCPDSSCSDIIPIHTLEAFFSKFKKPMNEGHEVMDTTFNEPFDTSSTLRNSDTDSETQNSENIPSKKKLKRNLTEGPLSSTCSQGKDHREDVTSTGHKKPMCDDPNCRADEVLKEEIHMTLPCKHHLCISCTCDQNEEGRTVRCKVSSCQPSKQDNRRMTAGKSSNLPGQKVIETKEQNHKLLTGSSGMGKQSTVGSSVDKTPLPSYKSPSMNEDHEMEDVFDEQFGTLSTTTNQDTDSEAKNFENIPSKKRFKKYIKEKPCSSTCSRDKNHGEAVIEFSNCSHRMCEDCINKKVDIKCATIFCGIKIGARDICGNKVPYESVTKYLEDRRANIMVKIKLPSRKRCSMKTCRNLADAELTDCGHCFCLNCMFAKSSRGKAEKSIFCGIGFLNPCRTVIQLETLNECIRDILEKPSFYIEEKPHRRRCDEYLCNKEAVIEFRKCGDCMCLDCVSMKVSSGETVICGCGFFYCDNKIPTKFVIEYLRNNTRNDTDFCDNPNCTAESLLKTKIRKTFPCKHKLCIICVSAQQTREDDVIVCKACAHSKITQTDPEIAGIPNVGLTCYAGCVLQVLGQTPGFEDILCKYSQESEQDDVETLLKKLLELVNVGSAREYFVNWTLMQRLMRKIFQIDRSFRQYQENDCHSFIMALFNALMKTEQDQKKQKYVGNSFLDGPDPDDASGLVKGTENITHDRRPNAQADLGSTTSKSTCPTTLFESRVTSQFKYSSCRHTENVDDQLFYSFLLPAAVDVKSIDEGLDLYFKSEEFPDNVLQCRECSTQDESTITTRTLLMSAAPDTLMIQLARFSEVSSVDSHYKELEKTNHPVKFGEILTIKKAYTMNERELKYELYGVVLHIGNMHGGHYTSCVRNLKSRKWYFCNDSSVSEMPENAVLQPRNFRNAYLLFYSKKK